MNSPHGNWILAIDADVTAPVPVEEGGSCRLQFGLQSVRLGVSSAVYTGLQPARIDAHRHAVNSWSGLIIRRFGVESLAAWPYSAHSCRSIPPTRTPRRSLAGAIVRRGRPGGNVAARGRGR